ncbi:MAG: DUF4381 domain-containing protein [Verrucomicrobiota bacterium]
MNPDPTSLDRLHDLVVPPPVPWWPPAPGWYWVLGTLAVVAAVAAIRLFLRWQHNRYRREALAEWRRHEASLGDPAGRAAALAGLAELLKRTALSAWPRPRVASLTGADWLAFLDKTGATTGFSSGHGALLENAAYDPRSATALEESMIRETAVLVRHWLKHHRAGGTV